MVVTLKGSIDNTNDLKWTINHISSCSQHRANKNARGCKPRKRWKQEKGKMFERASKIFSLLLPLTVSPSQLVTLSQEYHGIITIRYIPNEYIAVEHGSTASYNRLGQITAS